MIKFNAKNEEELEQELFERSEEIGIEIVRCILDGLDAGVDKVIVGVLVNLDAELSAKRESFLVSLKENLHRIGDAEEFELCVRAKNWIEKLETES